MQRIGLILSRARWRFTGAASVGGLAVLVAALFSASTAGATTFTYSNGFGASGIANTLDQPTYDAIDPTNHYIYVSNYRYDATNTVERFNYDGTPAPFTTTSGDVNSNVLGVADSNSDKAVFRGTDPGSFNCSEQQYYSGGSYDPYGIRCFDDPQGIAVDQNGNVYVANSGGPTVDIFDKTGMWIGEIGPFFDSSNQNGYELANFLGTPAGLTYDTTNNLLFVGSGNGNIWVFHGTGTADPMFTYVGQLGSSDGTAPNQFYYPAGLTTDDNGNLYIADGGNSRIDHWTYSLSGSTVIASPVGSWKPTGANGAPQGITYTPGDGNQTPASVFVTDEFADDVEQFSPTGSQLGTFGVYGGAVGQFENPFGIASLANDGTRGTNLYIVDSQENQVDHYVPAPHLAATNTKVTSSPSTASSTKALSAAGQVVKVKTVSGATVTLELILDKKTAKAADLGSGKVGVVIGKIVVKNVKASSATIKAIMTKHARRALLKYHRQFKMTLHTTFTVGASSYAVNRLEVVHFAAAPKKK